METSEVLDFVAHNHRAVLATLRADGSPQLSPVTASIDDAGHVVVSTIESSVKVKHLRRDPRLWLCVLTERFFGQWAWLEGDVEIVELPDAMQPLMDYYRSVSGEHPDWDEYQQAMRDQARVLLRVTVKRAGPSS